MERRSAELFLAVVEHEGVTRAAEALYMTQPSLSAAIRSLEKRYGVTLFVRSGRRMTPTEAGVALIAPARQIIADVERAEHVVQQVVSLRAGELVLSAVSGHAAHPLPGLVARLKVAIPDVKIVIFDGSAESVESDLREGRCEVAITDSIVRFGDDLCEHRAADEEIVLVVQDESASLPDPLPRVRLEEVPLVLELGDRWLRSELEGHLKNVVVECAQRHAMWELVAHGAGAALMSGGSAARALPGKRFLALDPPVRRPFIIAHRAGAPSAAATAVLTAMGMQCPPDQSGRR